MPEDKLRPIHQILIECPNGHVMLVDHRDRPCSICEALQKFEEELGRLCGLIKKLQDEKKDKGWDDYPCVMQSDVRPMCGES